MNDVAGVTPKDTAVAPLKLMPLTLTACPPAEEPEFDVVTVTDGATTATMAKLVVWTKPPLLSAIVTVTGYTPSWLYRWLPATRKEPLGPAMMLAVGVPLSPGSGTGIPVAVELTVSPQSIVAL